MRQTIFISIANQQFAQLRTDLRNSLSGSFDVVVQPDFHAVAVDTIRKLDQLIESADLLIHMVGELPGSVAHPDAVADFFKQTDRPLFLNNWPRVSDLLGDCTSLTYAQWEPWLALNREKPVIVYAVSGHDEPGFPQREHLDNLRLARCHAHVLKDETLRLAQVTADGYNHFGNSQSERLAEVPSPSDFGTNTLIGRTLQIEVTSQFLAEGRPVVLWGPGGFGKTAIARELKTIEESQGSKCLWIELLRSTDENDVRAEILRSITGPQYFETQPIKDDLSLAEKMTNAIVEYRPDLIVLDNAEHVSSLVGTIVQELQSICATFPLQLLITSQDMLLTELPGSPVIPIEAIAYPDPDKPEQWNHSHTKQSPSSILLLRRARGRITAVDENNWVPIAEICFALKGHPLLLELAGGFIADHPELALEDIAFRVQHNASIVDDFKLGNSDSAAAKSRSVLASIAWSLSLRTSEEQELLTCLSHMPDGFSVPVAASIALQANCLNSIEKHIAQFCSTSILTPLVNGRYRIVEVIRSYLASRDREREGRLLLVCIRGITDCLEQRRMEIACDPEISLIRELADERGNISVLLSLVGKQEIKPESMCSLLALYLPVLDRIESAINIKESVEPLFEALSGFPIQEQCRIMRSYSKAVWATGDWRFAEKLCIDLCTSMENTISSSGITAVEAFSALPNEAKVDVLMFLADAARIISLAEVRNDNHADAHRILDTSFQLLDRLPNGDLPNGCLAFVSGLLTIRRTRILDREGKHTDAIEMLNCFINGELWSSASLHLKALIYNDRGLAEWHLGNLEDAESSFEEAANIFRRLVDRFWLAGALTNLGFVNTDLEQFQHAIDYCVEADQLHRAVLNRSWEGTNLGAWGLALAWNGNYEEGLRRLERGLSLTRKSDPETAAQFKGDIARVLIQRGGAKDLDRAVMLLEEAIEFQSKSGKPSRRWFGNSVLLADALKQSGESKDVVVHAVHSAIDLAARGGFAQQSPTLQIRKDCRKLDQLESSL
jgi:tetratricopeptide (TPR) repeat protein